ncbi:MAG: 4-coumarate--CoA ligase family protein [Gemmatimonadetes bacterium]|nr:4-coumarate--CoA ligase family protein [Gemmatimonadota bacterium]
MIIRSPHPDIAIPDLALVPYVFRDVAQYPDRTAITCGVTGRSYTFGQLYGAIRAFAAGLHAKGYAKGDVIGIVSPNVPEYAIAFMGPTLIGALASTVNPIATADEIATQFRDSRAKMIVTIPLMLEKCREAAAKCGNPEVVVFGEAPDATPFASLLRPDLPVPDVPIDLANDLCVLPYSSGTSGVPKGVMLTHRNLVANMEQFIRSGQQMEPTDIALGLLPFFHIYGMVVIMNGAISQGRPIVTLPKFELPLFLETIQKFRITVANVVPPILLALAKHPIVSDYDLSSLRFLGSGAAPLGEPLALAAETRLKVAVRQGYGLTETSPVTHFHPLDGPRVTYGSIGPMVPNTEARIVSTDSGEDVGVGEKGELWLRGPQVMKGYFNKPEATAACMTPDGWFKTGDVAVVDEHGWFEIVDRVKELIKYKGMQVAPAELEAHLLSHPAIADAAVIPIPDEEAGEVPKAYVVTRAAISPEDIMAFIAERVSPYKKIRAVEITDAIPKSPSGKILRRFLVDRERMKREGTLS